VREPPKGAYAAWPFLIDVIGTMIAPRDFDLYTRRHAIEGVQGSTPPAGVLRLRDDRQSLLATAGYQWLRWGPDHPAHHQPGQAEQTRRVQCRASRELQTRRLILKDALIPMLHQEHLDLREWSTARRLVIISPRAKRRKDLFDQVVIEAGNDVLGPPRSSCISVQLDRVKRG